MRYSKKISYRKRPVFKSSKKYVKKLSPSFRQAVRKVIARTEETFQYNLNNQYGLLGTNGTATNTFGGLIPILPQAVGQGSRIGNKVQIVKYHAKCMISPTVTGATPVPLRHRVLVLYPRDNPGAVLVTSTGLFQNGNSSINIQNNYFDFLMNINTDSYVVLYDRQFIQGTNGLLSTSAAASSGQYIPQIMFDIDLTKHYKTLTFNDSATQPERVPTLLVITDAVDNSTGANASTVSVLNIALQIKFKNI